MKSKKATAILIKMFAQMKGIDKLHVYRVICFIAEEHKEYKKAVQVLDEGLKFLKGSDIMD